MQIAFLSFFSIALPQVVAVELHTWAFVLKHFKFFTLHPKTFYKHTWSNMRNRFMYLTFKERIEEPFRGKELEGSGTRDPIYKTTGKQIRQNRQFPQWLFNGFIIQPETFLATKRSTHLIRPCFYYLKNLLSKSQNAHHQSCLRISVVILAQKRLDYKAQECFFFGRSQAEKTPKFCSKKKKTVWEKIDRYVRCDVRRRAVVVVGDSERVYTHELKTKDFWKKKKNISFMRESLVES